MADSGKNGHSIFAYHLIKFLTENTDPYVVPSHIYGQIAQNIANNSAQTPISQPIQNAGDEGGQFGFRLATTGGTAKPKASEAPAPSAALTQAEQELKALEAQELQVEE